MFIYLRRGGGREREGGEGEKESQAEHLNVVSAAPDVGLNLMTATS